MTITGHDEADPAHGKIAFSSPLARALLGLAAGDFADFGGEEEAIEVDRRSRPPEACLGFAPIGC